ncbi:MAG: hypothetical protein AAB521_04630 [Patescibacteria group bacterium]
MEQENQVPPQVNSKLVSYFKDRKKLGVLLIPVLGILVILFLVILLSTKQQPQTKETKETASIIKLEIKYENPFDKTAQYVNPFASYKNPFDTLK